MTVPKYIQVLMSRASFVFGEGEPGYTIKIRKCAPYELVATFEKEIKQLEAWVNRQVPHGEFEVPTMIINSIPSKTHHVNQVAIVTIYDPVMKELERYIVR